MSTPNAPQFLLILGGTLVMLYVTLLAIGRTALANATDQIDTRRRQEELKRAEDELAEAAGRAAALEPLALNADGTIEEPILAELEAKT